MEIEGEFIKFIAKIFNFRWGENLETQHNRYDYGNYSLTSILKAYAKYYDKKYEFHYYCSDCSFPKFKNLETNETEACPECGD